MATTGLGRERATGAQTPFERSTILAAALALVDEKGLAALNMRALAAAMGVGTMSLYSHVPNKDALLDGIVEVVLGGIEIPPPESGSWDERAARMARSLRAVALEHPNCVPLMVTRPFATAPALRPCEAGFEVLAEAGLGADEAVVAFRTIVAYVLGFVMMESNGFFGGVGPDRDPNELLELGLPCLAGLAPNLAGRDIGADFDAGLNIIEMGALSWLGSGGRTGSRVRGASPAGP